MRTKVNIGNRFKNLFRKFIVSFIIFSGSACNMQNSSENALQTVYILLGAKSATNAGNSGNGNPGSPGNGNPGGGIPGNGQCILGTSVIGTCNL